MEKENFYEVAELQEYDHDNQKFPQEMYTVNKKEQPTMSKATVLGKASFAVAVILLLIAILGLQISTILTKDVANDKGNTICNCSYTINTSFPVSGTLTSTNNAGPNCSIVYNEWSDDMQYQIIHLQNQVSRLINTSEGTSWKIDDIRNIVDSQSEITVNNTINIDKILNTTENSAQKLINIVNTLSNLQDTSASTAGVVDDILLIAQELLELHNESSALPTSCQQIKQQQPNSPSGVYVLAATDGTSSYNAYCNMGQLCGSGGGWTRVAYLDMTDATQNCPSGFRLYQSGGVRACGRPSSSNAGCTSVSFPSNGISYSQVCGRVTGYQWGSPDAISFDGAQNNLNSYYVDGVSITRGSPRQHVWTLMAGLFQSTADTTNNCPCADGTTSVQSFIGNNYFCESGNPSNTGIWQYTLYSADPLWDGEGCGSLETSCCSVAGLPWFHRDYGNVNTTDNLELRVCSDQPPSNEDIPVSYYEIYIKK
uniref:Fibrinogen C-terminal domain-containing protein n=1 Tax=Amphimedon queenslandica TaxID=400682 RepID=A0A1X7T715_AMPQE